LIRRIPLSPWCWTPPGWWGTRDAPPQPFYGFGVVRIDGARANSGEVFGVLGRIERDWGFEEERQSF
jgi:hypothetical protein